MHKAAQISAEFQQFLDHPPMWKAAFDLVLAEGNAVSDLRAFIVLCALEAASDYDRRIASQCRRFPLKAVWLVSTRPLEACGKRKAVAAELLQLCSLGELQDDFSNKLATLFGSEMRSAAQTGQLCPRLHDMLSLAFGILMVDTQEIEGVNSIIKYVTTISPNISTSLLQSRILINKKPSSATRM
jgi:hypothetical protein